MPNQPPLRRHLTPSFSDWMRDIERTPGWRARFAYQFTKITFIGGFAFLAGAALLLLVDRVSGTHLLARWYQIVGLLGGALLLPLATVAPLLRPGQRLGIGGCGALLLLAALDSLDGAMQWLPIDLLLLTPWPLLFIFHVDAIIVTPWLSPHSRRAALAIALLAAAAFGVLASYAYFSYRALGSIPTDTMAVCWVALILNSTLQMMRVAAGRPFGGPTGPAWTCPVCGQHNIIERTICKRCRSPFHSEALRPTPGR